MNVYLQVENASKSFGDIDLFSNINFSINEGEKVALIAKNGSGKTTLLNILAGLDTFDSGKYYLNKDIKISYLPQDPQFNPELSVFETIYGAPGELMQTVRNYEQALHEHNPLKLEEANAQMDFNNAWDLEARIRQILGVLKLNDENQKVAKLSGGQVKRLALAVALVNEPDFLMLDEPTNHLDLDMIEWFEEYLMKSGMTFLMVTHDRYFLERICDEIIEIDEHSAYTYIGNYSAFIQKRSERILNKALSVEKAQNILRKELVWMSRMPKARTTKAKYRIDAYYDLQKQADYRRNDRQVKIDVKSERLGNKILILDNVSKKFHDTLILDNFSYKFAKGEKLGIIGPNGVGKTTFLNIITGALNPDSGNIDHGETVVYGYYKQQGPAFKEGKKVIDVIQDIAEVKTLSNGKQFSAVQLLNRFLFTAEMHNVYVEKLSGGEKRRLYLLTVLMLNPNFLILDEPTNDFDILTLNVLEEFLNEFKGCLILVSHDRFFMDKLVDHLFIFEGNGEVYDFPGNYSEYRLSQRQREIENRRNKEHLETKKVIVEKSKAAPSSTKKMSFKEKKELEELTNQIEDLEKEKTELEARLNSGKLTPDELFRGSKRIGEVIAIIDQKTNRWLELSD
ncbi:MAG TPA: ABC-F family ATP-binding cassette domain-containing protein [Bacteroidales bacterium]|jgi:ATP-binding cassette subfamily F protein uup|nr:ABC-F family ATP-binding cassette domain-containing protein [Bacteroidales bacterium]